jgi:histidinol-phosphatase (PHP family)
MVEKFHDATPSEVYGAYYREYLRMINSNLFDIAGHLDYPKKYGNRIFGLFKYENYKEMIDPILEAIIERNMVIEINTKGWRSEAREQYPSTDILSRYKKLGGQYVTIGSDAHRPLDVGSYFKNALKLASEIDLQPVVYATRQLFPWGNLSTP